MKKASVAVIDVRLKLTPENWLEGEPEFPTQLVKVSPGSVTISLFNVAAFTVKLELAGPLTVPSLAVIVVVSCFFNVVVSVVVDTPLVKLTAVVYKGGLEQDDEGPV